MYISAQVYVYCSKVDRTEERTNVLIKDRVCNI